MLEIPSQIWQKTKTSYIWRSLFRHGYPDSRKNQSLAVFTNVFLHLHPVKVRRHALAIPYTWCMGGLSFFLFLILTLTCYSSTSAPCCSRSRSWRSPRPVEGVFRQHASP